MSDLVPQEQTGNQAEIEETPNTEKVSVETLQEQLQETQRKFEMSQAAQSGSDRKVAELTKQIEELKKIGMSEKERAAYEKQIADQERENFEREKKLLENDRQKFQFIAENKIDPRFEKFLSAETREGLDLQSRELKALIEEQTKPLIEEIERIKAGASRPGGGSQTTVQDWSKMSVSDRTREFNRIKQEQGVEAANRFLTSIQPKR